MGKVNIRQTVGDSSAASDGQQQVRLFLDTEFFTFKGIPQLLSIALVSEAGQFIYMELPADERRALAPSRMNKFLKEQVLPQFDRIPEASTPTKDMPTRLLDWLGSLNASTTEVVYDYSTDYLLLERLLAAMPAPPATKLIPVHVGYALADPTGQAEAELMWQRVEAGFGIQRHHALADAMALVGRFRAIHGDPPQAVTHANSANMDGVQVLEVEAVVSVVLEEFELVHAETSQGVTLSIGEGTPGVHWTSLQVGQRLLCTAQFGAGTRVLHAKLVPPD